MGSTNFHPADPSAGSDGESMSGSGSVTMNGASSGEHDGPPPPPVPPAPPLPAAAPPPVVEVVEVVDVDVSSPCRGGRSSMPRQPRQPICVVATMASNMVRATTDIPLMIPTPFER